MFLNFIDNFNKVVVRRYQGWDMWYIFLYQKGMAVLCFMLLFGCWEKVWEKKKFVENDENEWFETLNWVFFFPDEEFEESKRKGKMINIKAKVGKNDWSQLVFGGLCECTIKKIKNKKTNKTKQAQFSF